MLGVRSCGLRNIIMPVYDKPNFCIGIRRTKVHTPCLPEILNRSSSSSPFPSRILSSLSLRDSSRSQHHPFSSLLFQLSLSGALMSRLTLSRMAPWVAARIQKNQRLLSSAVTQPSPSPESLEPVHMTDNCIRVCTPLSLSLYLSIYLSIYLSHSSSTDQLTMLIDQLQQNMASIYLSLLILR
jgi:hypothetical protein